MKARKLFAGTLAGIISLSSLSVIKAETAGYTVKIYVSPNGDDITGDGSISKPYETVARAQQNIQNYISDEAVEKISIILREGEYPPIEITDKSCGNEKTEVEYRGFDDEIAVITNAEVLSPESFTSIDSESFLYGKLPESARENILSFDLTAAGITDVQPCEPLGNAQNLEPCEPGLFIDDYAMRTARWPNDENINLDTYATASAPVLNENGGYDTVVTYTGQNSRMGAWSIDNAYMCGYLDEVYFFKRSKITEISDTMLKIESSELPMKENAKTFFCNIPEELDSPGEWYYSPDDNKIYMYPPHDITNSDIRFAYKSGNAIGGKNLTNVSVDNLTVNGCRDAAINLETKAQNGIGYIDVRNCTVKNGGCNAVIIVADNVLVENNHIYNMGSGGISVYPNWWYWLDNIKNIKSNNQLVTNNYIHDINQVQHAYAPGIYVCGTCSAVSHNVIHGLTGSALTIASVCGTIEYNEIYDAVSEPGDMGAIYIGGDWGHRGHTIRYNKIYGCNTTDYINGIFFDNCSSAHHVYGNIIDGFASAFAINGGQDNLIENNIVSYSEPNKPYKNKGMGIGQANGVPQYATEKVRKSLIEKAQSEAWSARWPGLDKIFENGTYLIPYNNTVRNNIFIGFTDEEILMLSDEKLKNWSCTTENNIAYENPFDFYREAQNGDLRYEIPQGTDGNYLFDAKGADNRCQKFLSDYIGDNYNFATKIKIDKFPSYSAQNENGYEGIMFEVDNNKYLMKFYVQRDGIYAIKDNNVFEKICDEQIAENTEYVFGVKVREDNAQLYLNGELNGSFKMPEYIIGTDGQNYDNILLSYHASRDSQISFTLESMKLDRVYPGCGVIADYFDGSTTPAEKVGITYENLSQSNLTDGGEQEKDGLFGKNYLAGTEDKSAQSTGYVTYTVPDGTYITDISLPRLAVPRGNALIEILLSNGETQKKYNFSKANDKLKNDVLYAFNYFRYSTSMNDLGKQDNEMCKWTSAKISITQPDEESLLYYDTKNTQRKDVGRLINAVIVYTGEGMEASEGIYNIYNADFKDISVKEFNKYFTSGVTTDFDVTYIRKGERGITLTNTFDSSAYGVIPVSKIGNIHGGKVYCGTVCGLSGIDNVSYKSYDDGNNIRFKFFSDCEEPFSVILGGYNNGSLVTTAYKNIKNDDEITIQKKYLTDIKIFAWNSINGEKPLDACAKMKIEG